MVLQINTSFANNSANNRNFPDLPDQASDVAREAIQRGRGYENRPDRSDLNHDGYVDTDDLVILSGKYLKTDWQSIEWCLFYESVVDGTQTYKPVNFFPVFFTELLEYVYDEYGCAGEPLPPLPPPLPPPHPLNLVNDPRAPGRIAQAGNYTGDYYVTDAAVGSVFIYDAEFNLKQELKGLSRPLGLAVDLNGMIIVGNDGRDNIEVYDPDDGQLVTSFGEGLIDVPSDITIGPDHRIYIVDSRKHTVHVFSLYYDYIGQIGIRGNGPGFLHFPVSIAIVARDDVGLDELYIADQENQLVQVFGVDGTYLRSIAAPPAPPCGWFQQWMGLCEDAPASFTRLQSLTLDSYDRLHVLDMFDAKVSLFDPLTGTFISSYGSYGTAAGQLRLPMDVVTNDSGEAFVTDGGDNTIETYVIP
jgi:hypothetical protein